MADQQRLLKVRDLKLHFRTAKGPVQAVDGVSFALDRGPATVVVGESGCGKSTLSRAILRLLPRNVQTFSGEVWLNGTDIMQLGEDQFRRQVRWVGMSLVSQAAMNSLNPVMKVGDQVAEPLLVHGRAANQKDATAQAREVLRLVGVSPDFLGRYPFELSGGMRQRAVLAMALIGKPDIVFLDEPTSALDVLTQTNIMNVLKGIKRDLGMTFILITHDIATSSELADQAAVMYAGQLVELSDAEHFFRVPLHPYAHKLMACVPTLRENKELEFIPGQPPSLLNPPEGCRFAERCERRFDRCTQEPALFQLEDGRQVKCWLYESGTRSIADVPCTTEAAIRLPEAGGTLLGGGGAGAALSNVGSEGRAAEPGAGYTSTMGKMTQEALLSVENLRTWYELRKWGVFHAGYVKAVDGVSFALHKGEAITIVGESGSGKTTLAKTVLGLVPSTEGEMSLAGERLSGRKGKALAWLRANVGFVQQDPYGALPPFMSVRRILSEPQTVNGVPKRDQEARLRAVMGEVRLIPQEDFIEKYPHMLSGGQQQRLVIARAIVLKPMLVVADEPVSMLDASVRVEILQLLRGIQEKNNLGVMYITHDLSTVRYFSEFVFVMYAAKMVEKARVEELIHNPLHPYTKALLAAISDPNPDNAHIIKDVPSGEPPSLANPPAGCRFHPRCKDLIPGLCDVDEPGAFEPVPGHTVECWLFRQGGCAEESAQAHRR
jgi:peptide/nickel transport system ATP-binding protein